MKRMGISNSYALVFEYLKKLCLNIILSVKIVIPKKEKSCSLWRFKRHDQFFKKADGLILPFQIAREMDIMFFESVYVALQSALRDLQTRTLGSITWKASIKLSLLQQLQILKVLYPSKVITIKSPAASLL